MSSTEVAAVFFLRPKKMVFDTEKHKKKKNRVGVPPIFGQNEGYILGYFLLVRTELIGQSIAYT